MKHKPQRIQNRFIVFFILVSLPPLIFLGLVASWSVTKTRVINVSELELRVVQNIADRTEKLISDSIEAIELHVPDKVIADIGLIPEEQRRTLLEQFMSVSEFRYVQEITMVDVRGKEVQKLRRDFQPALLQATPIVENEKFSVAVAKGRYASPVYFQDGVPMMTISARIVNGSGFLIGVFTAETKLTFIQDEVLKGIVLGESGHVYVVDQDGKHIGASDDAKRIGKVASLPIVQSVLLGNVHTGLAKGDRYANMDGVRVFGAGRPVPNFGLGVIAEWPEHDAFAVVRTIQQQIIIFVLSTFGLILIASLFLARQVTKPIEMLRSGAAVIGGGKFEHRIALNRYDELGELADSFNEMAVQLKKIDELKTIQIRNEALAESLKKEQELSRQKDVFISVMSHQLRTPLTALQWGMEYLSGEVGKPEFTPYRDTIKDAAESSQQITAIVDDLLTVSELGIGYRVKATESMDLSALLKELGSVCATSQAKAKGIACSVALPPVGPLMIEANPKDMRKVFLNLFDNAVTYTKQGSITVTVKEDGGNAVVVITDTGVGIPAKEQKDIFREFFRATNAIVGKNVGTGLGLFIVKTIVTAHGGSVAVVSEENKGSTFTVTLPKKQQGQKEEKVVSS